MTPTPSLQQENNRITLEKYLDSRLDALKETIRAAYPDRNELLEMLDQLNHRITLLEISKAQLEGKASQSQFIFVTIIAVVSLLLALIDWLSAN